MTTRPQISIIGGGAAGLMCAATLVEQEINADIHLFEKNSQLGSKVIISGGGRCNVTTGITDKKILLSKYTRGGKFLKTAIGHFPPEKVIEWFESHGVPLKTETDQRVFPVSNKGKDIVRVFEKLFQQKKVHIHFNEEIKNISPNPKGTIALTSTKNTFDCDYVILSTGGNAYQHTGSTGDGYHFAREFGHSTTALKPSLSSFLCQEQWPKELSGISLSKASLRAQNDEGKKISSTGPLLFTHFGLSGPAVFALSSLLAFTEISPKKTHQVFIRPLAEKNINDWTNILKNLCQTHGAQQIRTCLREYFPQRLSKSLLLQIDLTPEKKCSELSKKEQLRLAELLGGQLKLTLTQRRPGDEFVTAGGIPLEEIDSKSMQSKLNPRLFFAGEIMDIDGVTGGFNLQASWATGRLAAFSLIKLLGKK